MHQKRSKGIGFPGAKFKEAIGDERSGWATGVVHGHAGTRMVMNRKQLVARLKGLGLPKGGYVLVAGGAMVMHGLRAETADLDIIVSPEVFEALGRMHGFIEAKPGKPRFVDLGSDVELSDNFDNAFPADSLSHAIEIDGVRVQPLEDILGFKEKLNRPKDQHDIKLLRDEIERRLSR